MTNIYSSNPQLLAHPTSVVAIRPLDKGGYAVSLHENIIRPKTEGQPQDHALLTIGYDRVPTGEVFKADSETWITLDGPLAQPPGIGEAVFVEVNAERRSNLSRSHSLSHLLMAATKHLTTEFDGKGAFLGEDERTIQIRFRAAASPSREVLQTIDCLARSLVLADRPIETHTVNSVEIASRQFRHWRIDADLNFNGKTRVVHIVGIDANACSGSHVTSTKQVGAFGILGCRVDRTGTNILTVQRSKDWTYWFSDMFLAHSSLVDLKIFDL